MVKRRRDTETCPRLCFGAFEIQGSLVFWKSRMIYDLNMDWAVSTNFQKVFDNIFEVVIQGNLSDAQMLNMVFVSRIWNSMRLEDTNNNNHLILMTTRQSVSEPSRYCREGGFCMILIMIKMEALMSKMLMKIEMLFQNGGANEENVDQDGDVNEQDHDHNGGANEESTDQHVGANA
ncbi:hypothetical protein H5410_047865 [Solanum commersonii]|uniref:DUF7788 domain-containing protein n=1 Tax=Solanum commersonii TaxID=4109 RepID=A0A9J5XIL4_SOLCO|nr:hypothetical protein H5410_047865 [Solanum commersonii]